jgi:hypothetical protein
MKNEDGGQNKKSGEKNGNQKNSGGKMLRSGSPELFRKGGAPFPRQGDGAVFRRPSPRKEGLKPGEAVSLKITEPFLF